MKFKSLMLGAAAAAAATTAQAADLPVAPEPVDYVRICDAYGAFYYYIPGTETCIRVGGRVRTQVGIGNVLDDNETWGVRGEAGYTWRTDGRIAVEAITATEFGDLVTSIALTSRLQNGENEGLQLDTMNIQWGGLVAGRAGSQFDIFTGTAFIGSVTRNWSDASTNQLSYTAAFGSGFSAVVSLEDGSHRESGDYGGTRLPDAVGALMLSQGWGSAQLSGALHQVFPASPLDKDQLGWAVAGGATVNLPMLADGAEISLVAGYADGALSYVGGGDYDDYVGDDLSTGWNIGGGIYYPATSTVSLALDGSYLSVDVADTTADVTRYALDASVRFEPVQFLAIGADVGYANTEVDGSDDTDELVFGVRMERTF